MVKCVMNMLILANCILNSVTCIYSTAEHCKINDGNILNKSKFIHIV